MGKTDTVTKNYMRRPDVFADVFNQFLYHGRQMILPDRLVELDTTEIAVPYGADYASVPEQRYRDVAKLLMAMTDGYAAYCILAAENEGKIHYAAPVKNCLYDAIQLAHQVTAAAASHRKSKLADKNLSNKKLSNKKLSGDEFLSGFWKEDRLLPVVTVVIYFGAEEWDGPLSLHEMYSDCSEEIRRYAMDYRVNLITPSGLSDSEIDEFQSNMREIMRYIKYSKDKKKLHSVIGTELRFKCVERDAAEIINAATGSNMKIDKGKESVDVCIAIQGMMEDSRIEGAITFAQKLGAQKEQVKKSIMEEFDKDDKEAEELIQAYWK